jgi:hypothetical protein
MCIKAKKLDLFFKQKVFFTFEKSEYIRTKSGAAASVLLFSVVLTVAVSNYLKLFSRELISLTYHQKMVDTDIGFVPGDFGFNLAFGFNN